MWLEVILQVVTMLLKNCPEQATQENVERIIKNPTRRERRMMKLAMRREADKQLDAYLEGDDDVALNATDRDYICAEICEKLGIPHTH